ncbi:restriction endonuclease subunit S [Xanthomonas oryzae]|uniref:restriction endonuclease subunit S n=16 Tax=Xanthomonas oryzae TaxID=347 RepID=UPI0000679249|nr:restriction endonuclease subunit S [Xanthomonas oryzae]AXI19770.1 restriction endonuclease subunit S [Xanthomonas oryzae pv. oryzae]AXI23740.1 restriction endonuclease subunit S [Xanthomonas oryzae pv. oryzae]QUW77250.1 restriction endonuclease subunit S [Xanthomonas oryzae]WDN38501.1 restriction endonuclease subunit S [Xanthomonas oryzae]WDN40434.1 restriction endonuclease subunit S [Xanthomonas oryzae]
MSELPGGWSETEIGPVNTYSSETLNPAKAPKQTFELYSVPVFAKRKPEIVDGKDIGSTKQKVEPDDVLLCKINPRINRVWLVGKKNDHEQIASSEWIVIRQPLFDPAFIRFQLQESSFRDRLCAEVSGVGGSLTRAQPKKVESYKLRIAPLAEQKRIAQKLDALLAQVDTLKARIDAIPALLKRFRKSVVHSAVIGRLSADLRVPIEKSEEQEQLGPLESWREVTLASLGELSRGKSKHRPRNDSRLYGSEYPFIQTGDVANSGGALTSSKVFYSEFGLKQSRLFPSGTLCITIAANIADTAMLAIDACFPDSVVGFIPNKDDCVAQFIKYVIDDNKESLEALAPATAQKNINLKVLNQVKLRIPPIKEQTEIVRHVEQLFAYADQLEAKVAAAQQRIDALTQSLLAKAFRGELVPQDPSDEPASVLLDRIRAQRAATPKPKRGRKAATS